MKPDPRRPPGLLRYRRATSLLLLLTPATVGACSLLISRDANQCERAEDCAAHPGTTCDVAARLCVPATTVDSGSPDATDGASDSGPGVCTPARWPAAPAADASVGDSAVDGSSGGANVTLTVAFNTVDLGNQKLADGGLAYQDLGYDMDGLCTTSTEHLGCRVPAWATEGDPSDGADGRDNAVAKMLNRGGSSYVTSDSVNQAIASGESPVGLLRLSDYSGEPDDPQVKVEWFVPASSVPGEGGRLDYRVASQWLADSDAGVPDGGTPATSALFVASLPYVVDSTLVAPFPYRVVIIVRDTPVEVLSAVFTGKLVKETSSGQWTLTDGMIAGRSRVATLLSFFPALLKKTAGVVVCTNAPVYPTIKKVICGYADFNAFGAPVPTTDCDGLSIGIGLGSVATAIVGSEPRIVVQNCPEETDPGLDSCVAAPN